MSLDVGCFRFQGLEQDLLVELSVNKISKINKIKIIRVFLISHFHFPKRDQKVFNSHSPLLLLTPLAIPLSTPHILSLLESHSYPIGPNVSSATPCP